MNTFKQMYKDHEAFMLRRFFRKTRFPAAEEEVVTEKTQDNKHDDTYLHAKDESNNTVGGEGEEVRQVDAEIEDRSSTDIDPENDELTLVDQEDDDHIDENIIAPVVITPDVHDSNTCLSDDIDTNQQVGEVEKVDTVVDDAVVDADDEVVDTVVDAEKVDADDEKVDAEKVDADDEKVDAEKVDADDAVVDSVEEVGKADYTDIVNVVPQSPTKAEDGTACVELETPNPEALNPEALNPETLNPETTYDAGNDGSCEATTSHESTPDIRVDTDSSAEPSPDVSLVPCENARGLDLTSTRKNSAQVDDDVLASFLSPGSKKPSATASSKKKPIKKKPSSKKK